MYFYEIGTWDYEEIYNTIFMSSKLYGEDEFRDIVFKCYELACYDIIKNDPNSVCFCDIFFGADDAIVLNKNFDEIMAREYDLHSINGRKISQSIFFDLSFHNGTKENNQRLADVFNNLDIDESCWEDCWRLGEDKDCDLRNDCCVARRKGLAGNQ